MKWLRWFIAGTLAVPLFHQVALLVLNAVGFVSRQPFSAEPTEPFGVPQVVSLSFWGGVWGLILGAILERTRSRSAYWLIALVFGAIAPTLVAIFVVAPLKGITAPPGGAGTMIVAGLLVNAAWGLGTAAISVATLRPRSGPATTH